MSSPTYTRSDLRQAVLDQVHGNPDNTGTTVIDRLINRAVREVLGKVDLRSTKRSVELALSGANDVIYEETDGTYDLPTIQAIGAQASAYEYHCPRDVKGTKVIDIKDRTDRDGQYTKTTQEQFDRDKTRSERIFAISDNSWLRKLLVNGVPELNAALIHDCDAISEDGTFTAVGGASNVATETEEFVEGDGAITFDSDLGTATAGVANTAFTAVDLAAFEDHNLFLWVKIPEASLITSFTLRWGQDASNYYEVTVQQTHEQLAFYAGWNLLRFNWSEATETGSPTASDVSYLSFFMTKDAGKAAATGWIVDRIIAMVNSGHDVVYYSKYGWQTSEGTYLENATADTDFINADTDELELITDYASLLVSRKLGKAEDVKEFRESVKSGIERYTGDTPSEAKPQQTTYYHV